MRAGLVLLGLLGLSGCVAYSVASTAVGVTTTAIGTTVDVAGAAVSTTADVGSAAVGVVVGDDDDD